MKKAKDRKYIIKNTCSVCGQNYYDPTTYIEHDFREAKEELKLARHPHYRERPDLIRTVDMVIDRDKDHTSSSDCIQALKTYIDNVKTELENSIPSECSCCRRY